MLSPGDREPEAIASRPARLRAAVMSGALAIAVALSSTSGCARMACRAMGDPCASACGECEQRGARCRQCALGHRVKCKLHAGKHKRPPVELPPEDMPDFPRFHPVPLQPVFSRRDFHGFPVYAEVPLGGPLAAPTEEIGAGELTLPDPAAGAARSGAARSRSFQPASWIFTPKQQVAPGMPVRNARPAFAVEKPLVPNPKPAGR